VNIDGFKKTTDRVAVTLVALFWAGVLFGQGMPTGGQYPQGQRQPGQNSGLQNQNDEISTATNLVSDEDFLKDAAQGSMTEVKLGQLAEDKGSSDEVKNFGKRMVEDHSKVNEELKDIATREKMKLPTELSKKNQKTYERLSELSGEAFDHAYARGVVRDQQSNITAFRQEASGGQNQAIKKFASETLPTLENHLKMAREMEQSLGSKSGGQ